MSTYLTEVRASRDCALLGHLKTRLPWYPLPAYVTFVLTDLKVASFQHISLRLGEVREGANSWKAFIVSEQEHEQIKGLLT